MVRNISAGIHAQAGLQYHLSDFRLLSLQASIHYGCDNDHAQNSPGAFTIGLADIAAFFCNSVWDITFRDISVKIAYIYSS